jgi:PhnB protein
MNRRIKKAVSTKAIPIGYHTITPYFSVRYAPKLIAYLKEAFDAQEIETHALPDGTIINAQIKIGDSMILIGEAPKGLGKSKQMPAMLYMYVNDADAVYKKAIRAGGKSIREPMDQFYGDRSAAVEDPAGNQWWIATHMEEMSRAELVKRASQARDK